MLLSVDTALSEAAEQYTTNLNFKPENMLIEKNM